jgi:hypothetical protein
MPDVPDNPKDILAATAVRAAIIAADARSDAAALTQTHPALPTAAERLAAAAQHVNDVIVRSPSSPNPHDNVTDVR